jgi:uncharacterized membrane protein (DUF4010 family)
MEIAPIYQQLAIALGLGLLVGLQRERTNSRLAGFRTFPLITLLGAVCAHLAGTFGPWTVAVGLAGLIGLLIVGNLPSVRPKEPDPGLTSEVAMLVMFAVGALLIIGQTALAIAIGGTVAVLLHLKSQMHDFASRIGDRDFTAVMQFALITLVILPVLPNQFYGPYLVLNPFKIWLMVVLIVGISLGGYIVYKLLGPRAGTLAAGVLGGLISSTATTASYARRTSQSSGPAALAAFVIVTASTIVFVRVLVLVGATSPAFLSEAVIPVAVMLVAMALPAIWFWFSARRETSAMPAQENPAELKPAILFATLYAIVLIATAAAREFFGQGGLYVVAILSGLTDMDAITLSVSQMVSSGKVSSDTGWRVILIAAMSNLVFKGGMVVAIGDRTLAKRVAWAFTFAFLIGLLLVLHWPAPVA